MTYVPPSLKHASQIISDATGNVVATEVQAAIAELDGQITEVSTSNVTVTVAASDSIYKTRADYICDGTDDGVEINQAIVAIKSVGGVVQLLGGTYVLKSTQILQYEGVSLRGEGMKATLITMDDSHTFTGNTGMIKLEAVDPYEGGGLYGLSLFGDGGVDGVTGRADGNATVDGVEATSAANIYDYVIFDVGIRYCRRGWDCDNSGPGSSNERFVPFENCEVWYNDYGLYMGEHASLELCDFRFNDVGVAGQPYDANFNGCKFVKNRIGMTGDKFTQTGIDNCFIQGGAFFGNEEDGLVIHEGCNVVGVHFGTGTSNCEKWLMVTGNSNQVTGCNFLRQSGAYGATDAAIYLNETVYNLSVVGCYFENFAGPVLGLKTTTTSRAVEFNDNNIRLGTYPILSTDGSDNGSLHTFSFCGNTVFFTDAISGPAIELVATGTSVSGNLWNNNTFAMVAAGHVPTRIYKGDFKNCQFCGNNVLLPEYYSVTILELTDDTGSFIAFNQGYDTTSDITTTGDGTFNDLTVAGIDLSANIELDATTTSAIGVIEKGGNRFIHDFADGTGGGAVPIGDNLFIGSFAGNFTTGSTATETYHASHNLGVGLNTLLNVTTGYRNLAIGAKSGESITTGSACVALGYQSLSAAEDAYNCLAIGYQSLYNNTSGHNNVAIGSQALLSNETNDFNVAIGSMACRLVTSSNNVGIGFKSLYNATSGGDNVGIGRYAGYDVTTGGNNTIVGDNTGRGIITGSNNTIIGANVSGLSSSLANTVVIADSAGHQRIIVDSSGNTKISADVTGSDYTEIEADGTLQFHGAATVWDDLKIVPGSFQFAGSGDPAIADWQPTGSGTTFKIYEFTTGDAAYATVQMPHSYKEGSNISVHIHWTPGDRGTTETTHTVAWKVDYSWSNIDGTFPVSGTADLTDACQNTNDNHLMTPEVSITGTGKNISSMLVLKIYRDSGDTWATNTAGNCPILLEVDFHFEKDTVGSRLVGSKS